MKLKKPINSNRKSKSVRVYLNKRTINKVEINAKVGPLMGGGGPQCRMSILRNGNVACLCRLFFSMSHVKFKKWLCPMSLQF